MPHFYQAYGNPKDEVEAVTLARRILSFPKVRRWGLPLTSEQFTHCRTFREVANIVLQAWLVRDGGERWGDKTPQYVSHLPTLLQIFPDAQVIHLIRDGRAVALSLVATPWGPADVYSASKLWAKSVSDGRAFGSTVPSSQYFELRYEELVDAPDETLRAIYEFLKEPIPETPISLNRPKMPRRLTSTGLRTDEVVAGNAKAWREKISARDRGYVNAAAGSLLAELGYGTGTPCSRVTALHVLIWAVQTKWKQLRRYVREPESLATRIQLWKSKRLKKIRG